MLEYKSARREQQGMTMFPHCPSSLLPLWMFSTFWSLAKTLHSSFLATFSAEKRDHQPAIYTAYTLLSFTLSVSLFFL
ncbi:hypothetical protein AMELA_G00229120 [Ameiurus melas]|uniref:Uncharacterized protein n=1 Tax=Ameiurus melas TaxID=219545 RepID=A0A7J5ZZ16_AMEME|nr:hypothetical protein AMELA_G00229120 [Ameiurus melas]